MTTSKTGSSKSIQKLNLVSLFSGGGGLDIGLGAAGFKTLFANDIIPQCCQTLEKNLPDKKMVLCEDIKKLSGELIRDWIVSNQWQFFLQ